MSFWVSRGNSPSTSIGRFICSFIPLHYTTSRKSPQMNKGDNYKKVLPWSIVIEKPSSSSITILVYYAFLELCSLRKLGFFFFFTVIFTFLFGLVFDFDFVVIRFDYGDKVAVPLLDTEKDYCNKSKDRDDNNGSYYFKEYFHVFTIYLYSGLFKALIPCSICSARSGVYLSSKVTRFTGVLVILSPVTSAIL